jgi:hypothetical protein
VSIGLNRMSQRDHRIMEMMAEFEGITYIDVLANTFWYGKSVPVQQARDRISKLKKYGLIRLTQTGFLSPKTAITFTKRGKLWIKKEKGLDVGGRLHLPTCKKKILTMIDEQIVYYWVTSHGYSVSKKLCTKLKRYYHFLPSLLTSDLKLAIEVSDIAKKSQKYQHILDMAALDETENILFVFKNEEQKKIADSRLPKNDYVRTITMEQLKDLPKEGFKYFSSNKDTE